MFYIGLEVRRRLVVTVKWSPADARVDGLVFL